jgi:hypothetical protein
LCLAAVVRADMAGDLVRRWEALAGSGE